MDNYRMIKLLLPSGKLINIQLGGDDNEFKDLISAITDLSPSQIKGIKDSDGNYYTISSALKSLIMIPTKIDQYYELIWSKQKIASSSSNTNINDNINHQRIILNSSPNVGNYYTNYFINEDYQKRRNFLLNFQHKSNIHDVYLVYLNNFFEKNLINKSQLNDYIKMIKTNNPDIIHLFNTFIDSKISLSALLKSLLVLSDKYNKKGINIDQILTKLQLFFSVEDMSLIKEMIKYENELIFNSFKEYTSTKRIDTLVDTIKKIINHYKNKSTKILKKKKPKSTLTVNLMYTHNFPHHKTLSSGSTSNSNKKIEEKLDIETNTKPPVVDKPKIKSNKSTKVIKLIKKKKESTSQMKTSTTLNKTKSTMKTSSVMMNELTEINKIIVRYAKENNEKEYENIFNIFKTADKKTLKKDINEYVSKYFQRELLDIGYSKKRILTSEDISLLHNFILSNYPSVVKAFKEFDKHFSITTLQKDLYDIIQLEKGDSASEDDEEEEDAVNMFFSDLDKIEISDKEKGKIELMIKSKNPKIMNIINEYSNSKSIESVQEKIKGLLRKGKGGSILGKLEERESPKKNIVKPVLKVIKPLSLTKSFSSYQEVLQFLQSEKGLSEDNLTVIKNAYMNKDEILLNYFNTYFKNNDMEELTNSLKSYVKSKSNNKLKVSLSKDLTKTPDMIKKTKTELGVLLTKKEKNVLDKQKEIIYLLYNEKCINEKTFNIINQKIEADEQTLIAAFEVYAVTKDHNEFIETLKIIANQAENYKGSFNVLLNSGTFSEAQKAKLTALYNENDNAIISALEVYEEKKDKEDAYNSFQLILKSHKK